ncbi:MAG: alpha/beta fold hydrolase [Paracoccaceae bacterium]
MDVAPFYNDIADGPADGVAFWTRADDGVRLRLAHWPGGDHGKKGGKGTVLLFPGRTEYVEKYGRAARDLNGRGYGVVCIDWRGQGLADRLDTDVNLGHVDAFSDYQRDVRAMVDAAGALNCAQPWFLMAHSMGGCIGLRAMHEGLAINAAAFSGPMWGLSMKARLRPLAWALSWASHLIGRGRTYAPGTVRETYVLTTSFEENMLSRDADMFAYMQAQARAHPELSLGGPSLIWLYEALVETRRLRAMTPPEVPTLTHLASNERVVDPRPVHTVMACWKHGSLVLVPGAEHEILMETPARRAAFFDEADTLYMAHSG